MSTTPPQHRSTLERLTDTAAGLGEKDCVSVSAADFRWLVEHSAERESDDEDDEDDEKEPDDDEEKKPPRKRTTKRSRRRKSSKDDETPDGDKASTEDGDKGAAG